MRFDRSSKNALAAALLWGFHDGRLAAADCPSLLPLADVGVATGGLAIADLDRDGDQDAAVGFTDDGPEYGVAVVRNMGNGRFVPAQRFYFGASSPRVTIGDLNQDQNPDIVAVNSNNNRIEIFYNLGNGFFAPPVIVSVGIQPIDAVIANLDGDPFPDIAVTNKNPASFGSVSVLRNLGNGAFAGSTIPMGYYPGRIAVGDVDRDGDFDLVVCETGTPALTVLRNSGSATFPDRQSYSVAFNLQDVVLVDVEHDGDLDMAFTDPGTVSRAVHLRMNDGSGNFGGLHSFQIGVGTRAIAAQDMDGDDLPELFIASIEDTNPGGSLIVLDNLGGGSFAPPQIVRTGGLLSALSIADFDGDSLPDVLVADESIGGIAFVGNLGLGNLVQNPAFVVGGQPFALAIADLEGDGHADLIVADRGTGMPSRGVAVLRNAGDATFGVPSFYPAGARPGGVAAGDLNHDGRPDVVVANQASNDVSVLLNRGDGVLLAQTRYGIGSNGPLDVELADLDNDTWLDVLIARSGDDAGVLWNNGDGTFSAVSSYRIGGQQSHLAVLDIENDGDLDIVATSNAVLVLRNQGGRNFAAASIFPAIGSPLQIATGDFDRDGFVDVAVSALDLPFVAMLRNNRAAGFEDRVLLPTNEPLARAIGSADVDGDGDIDLIVGSWLGAIALLLNDGAGQFGPSLMYSTSRAWDLQIGRLNSDDEPDLVTIDGLAGAASVLTSIGGLPQVWGTPDVLQVCAGSPLTIAARTGGGIPLAYQWRRNGQSLVDGGSVSGAQSATLTISPVAITDAGSYEVLVTNDCGYAIGSPTSVSVTEPGCEGDLNFDCAVNLADLTQLLAHFGTGPTPPAPPENGDINGDSVVDIRDLARLLSRYASNCP